MKRIFKKLIGMLSVICLLASLVLPAGMVSFAADDTSTTDPIVTEILFPGSTGAASSFSPAQFWYFGGDSVENAYTITFDYYLPKAVDSLEMDSVSGNMNTVSGNRKMNTAAGHHKFEWTTWTTVARGSQTGQFVARIKAPAGTEMYLWNWSVKIKGAEVIPSSLTEANAATNGTAGGRLSTYAWSKYMDDPTVTEITFPGTGTTNWSPKPAWYYGGNSEANAYTVSFDYYLPEDLGGMRFYSVSGGMTTVSGGAMDYTAGYHHFEWVTYNANNNGQLVTAIEATGGDVMYLWNWSVKVNGAEVTPTDKSAEWNGKTNGTIGGPLGSYAWAKYIDCPTVTEIDFSSGNAWTENIYKKSAVNAENPYVVTFEYFLESSATVKFDSVAGNIGTQAGSSNTTLKRGHHTFTGIYAPSAGGNCLAPRLKCSDTTAKLYIWDYSITVGGEAITRDEAPTAAMTTATVKAGEYLVDYAWYAYVDDPAVTVVTAPSGATGETYRWTPAAENFYFGGTSAETPYTIAFDYYLPETVASIDFDSVSGNMTTVSGSRKLSTAKGHHKVEWTTWTSVNADANLKGQFVPVIKLPVGSEMYIWNWSVKIGDTEVTPVNRNFNASSNADMTYGTAGDFLGKYDWAKYIDCPKVTEILFPGSIGSNSSFSPKKFWYFGGDSAENAYTITFDYYLPKAVASLELDSVSGMMTTVSGNRKMATTAGFHTFEWTTWTTAARGSQTGQFVAQIKAPAGTEMYLWNWSVKIKGAEVTPSTLTEANAATNGTEGKYLVDYVWANPDAEEPEKTVTSIEIATPPTKTTYEIGETLDTAGLSVKINYSDETSDTITEGFEVSGFDSATAGEKTVNVGYEGFSATFTVTVNEPIVLDSIVIASLPTKTEYEIGESLNVAGLSLLLTYSDGSTATINDAFNLSGFDSETAGEKTVTVTYEGFTATFTVTVKEQEVVLVDVAIATQPTKTVYEIGESLNVAGLSLLLTYSDGSTATVNDAISVSGFDSETAGEKTVTVTYEGFTATFTVTVKEAAVETNEAGDVNGDGEINNKDLGLVQRYINGWSVTIDEVAADVNDDGEINNKDLGLLQRYINGWDVTLK